MPIRKHRKYYSDFCNRGKTLMYILSGCELIDTENISLPSQNMKLGGEWTKRTSHKLHILSSRLIFSSINHIHIQMTCFSSLHLYLYFGGKNHMIQNIQNTLLQNIVHKYLWRLSRGYQELWQVHFCRTMFVDIADTTVPNLIYVLKKNVN